ncbi:MAG: hypothetical protein E7678_03405 [Ruminococcaceae bacterium]|nr:hypothetical protein [Oscillospiraceae bacterium]
MFIEKFNAIFNEKNKIWIQIYKIVTVSLFFVFVLFGFIAGLGDVSGEFLDIELGGDTIFDLFVWLIACSLVGFIQLVLNMLIIQLLNNVQLIRENIEKK